MEGARSPSFWSGCSVSSDGTSSANRRRARPVHDGQPGLSTYPARMVPTPTLTATSRRSFLRKGGFIRQIRHIYVRSPAEARAAVDALTSDDGLLPVAQEYVTGRACSVTAVVHSGAVIASSARATLSFFPLEGGTSVWKRTIPVETPGVEDALAFMRRWGLEGVAELEYVLSPLGPRFMELGPRIHGWIPLAEASSPGLLAAAIRTVIGEDVEPLPPYRATLER